MCSRVVSFWNEVTVSRSSITGTKMFRVNGRKAWGQIINSKILPTGMLSIARGEKSLICRAMLCRVGGVFSLNKYANSNLELYMTVVSACVG